MNEITSMNLGWVAGIIEGEGWFVRNKSTGLQICVAMTDYDTIERLKQITGIGRINERKFTEVNKKNQLQWTVGKRSDVVDLLNQILPLMSIRRSGQIQEVLDIAKIRDEEVERRKLEFVCGHPKTEDNTYIFKKRNIAACKTCVLNRSKDRYYSGRNMDWKKAKPKPEHKPLPVGWVPTRIGDKNAKSTD